MMKYYYSLEKKKYKIQVQESMETRQHSRELARIHSQGLPKTVRSTSDALRLQLLQTKEVDRGEPEGG